MLPRALQTVIHPGSERAFARRIVFTERSFLVTTNIELVARGDRLLGYELALGDC